MHNNRRHFIRTAGAGLIGFGIIPYISKAGIFPAGCDASAASGLSGDPSALTRATPESQGVSSQSIRDFIAAANASGFSWHSFMLLRHGQVIAEGWWNPYRPQYVHSLYSLSKSFTSTAIGLLVKEGKLDIHAKLISFFPGDLPAAVSDNLQQVTIKHVLTMNSGHGKDTLPPMRFSKDSWVRTYLAQPVEFAPGTHFLYNTGNTYMLGAVLNKITGQTLEQYLAPRLFKPLGITGYDWEVSPQGLNVAGYGLRVTTEDIAKLGQLYLQKGQWKGTPVLTEAWVTEATSAQTTSQVNNGDWSEGYGYQFWRCTHNFYRGDGAFGQYCIVMPELDAVMAVTGQTPDMQKSMNIIWDHIPGGMQQGSLPGNGNDHGALQKDLAALTLPVIKSNVSPASTEKIRKWNVGANDLNIQSVQLSVTEKGCELSATAAGDRSQKLLFGWESWVTNEARAPYLFSTGDFVPMPTRVAGTAAWIDERTLLLQVRFVEAIFGDSITLAFDNDRLAISFLNSTANMSTPKKEDPRKPLSATLVKS